MLFTEIFRSSNLNEQSFFLHCSSFAEEEKNEIIQTIFDNNGVRIINILLFKII